MQERKYVIGVDEVGVGAIAGPLLVCACYVPSEHWDLLKSWGFTDSKRISENKRKRLCKQLQEQATDLGVKWAYAPIDPINLDKLGPLDAQQRASRQAILLLTQELGVSIRDISVILDGRWTLPNLPSSVIQTAVPKADLHYLPVSVASVIAKTTRDNEITAIGSGYPAYEFDKNKGYPTPEHLGILWELGPIYGIHRSHYLRNSITNYYDKYLRPINPKIPKWINSEWLTSTPSNSQQSKHQLQE